VLRAVGVHQPLGVGGVQVQTLQGEQREEHHCLVAGVRSRLPTGSIRGLCGGEGQHALADVRIVIFFGRIGVMARRVVWPIPTRRPFPSALHAVWQSAAPGGMPSSVTIGRRSCQAKFRAWK